MDHPNPTESGPSPGRVGNPLHTPGSIHSDLTSGGKPTQPIFASIQATELRSEQGESKQLAFPAGTPGRLLTDGLGVLALLAFVLVVNQLVTRRGDRSSHQSLAKECQSLGKLRIGYPVGLTLLESLRSEQLLEKRLGSLGVRIHWIPYTSASGLLTDLSQGLIDFCGGGGTASLFSQAADHLFVRVAKEKYPDLDGDAIVVPEQSPITSIAQLKGKRIAFDEGSSAHYVLILTLKSVGLHYDDIIPVFLPQDEAAKAFVNNELDAWVHWVPYAPTPDRARPPARSIGDLKSILTTLAPIEIPTLYYALPELVRDYPRVLKAILEELNEAGYLANRQQLTLLEEQEKQKTGADPSLDPLERDDGGGRPSITLADDHPGDDGHRASLQGDSGVSGQLEAASHDSLESLDHAEIRLLRQRCLERAIVPIDDICLRGLGAQVSILSAAQLLPAKLNPSRASHTLQMRQNWTY